ncbi:MAG: M48 family metalloprotease [Cyanobacteria bacterium J06632_22]
MALTFDPDRLLRAGVHALKQRQYRRALATFEQLQQPGVPKAIQLKAQMGQVRVLRAQGKDAAVVEICESLAKSGSRHVQAWAEEQLDSLQRQPVKQTDQSGFQPVVQGPAQPGPAHSGFQALEPPNDQSGFQPIDQSGFQAFEPEPSKVAVPRSVESQRVASSPRAPQTSPSSSPKNSHGQGPSLFQYDALNQPPGTSSPSAVTGAEPVSAVPQAEPPSPQPETPPNMNAAAPETATVEASRLGWQPDTRLKTGRSLGQVKHWRLWFAQVGCTVLAFGTLRYLLHSSMGLVSGYLSMLDRILPLSMRPGRWLYLDYTWQLLAVLVVLGLAAPWFWDGWLRWQYQVKSYSTRELGQHSPEAVQLLRKVCLNRRWEFPTLRLLPTSVPVIFSYGWLPRYGRLVVSQGLLDQLEADEIAALYAYELNHWRGPDWPLLSLVGLLLQVIHGLHRALARWGNRQKRLVTVAAGTLSTLCYGVFWLLHKTVCWVARVRTYYRDRAAVQLTGHPNGLIRALGKLSFALSESIALQGYTPPLIERLSPLLPVGATSTLPLYGERQHQPLPRLLQWDALNPWRSWLSVNQPQPPLGDRLQLLTAYARHWRLTPTLDFSVLSLSQRRANRLTGEEWRRLMFQAGPWSGLAIGGLVGAVLWVVGAIATRAEITFLDWLNQDWTVLKSAALLGLGVGIVLRINAFFPDLSPQLTDSAEEYAHWLMAPDLLPSDSLPVQLSGQLVGPPGIANWLGQDLWLKTERGLVKLHLFSVLGPIGNCLKPGAKPHQYLGQTVSVKGWFRRGHQVWIDVQQLKGPGWTLTGNHPVWSLVLCVMATLSGLWILVRG